MPIQLVEAIFPDRRDGAWLDGRGLAAASILFIIGSAATWYLWSHVALQRFPAAQGYRSPVLAVALAVAVIAVLMALALVRRRSAHAPQVAERRAPRPWLVGVIAFLLGLVWLALTLTAFDVAPSLNSVIPILLAAALAGGAVLLVRRWARRSEQPPGGAGLGSHGRRHADWVPGGRRARRSSRRDREAGAQPGGAGTACCPGGSDSAPMAVCGPGAIWPGSAGCLTRPGR